jgi:glycosyltransferase involved in cell wall biosynthesis
MWALDRINHRVAVENSAQRATDAASRTHAERLLYVANVAWFFRSHRLPLAVEAVRRGYQVHLATHFEAQEERDAFEKLGIITHEVPFERSGTTLSVEIQTVLRLRQVLADVNPALCHNVSIKPVIYGGTLARLYGIPTINAISGMGYSYIAKGAGARLRRAVLNTAYSLAVKAKRSRVIVQNPDDRGFFERCIGVNERQLVLIKGSGVDLKVFHGGLPPATPPLVVLPARMLSDKGVLEFTAAAQRLKRLGIDCRFALVGGLDPPNRAALSLQDLQGLTADGAVEWWGHRSDMPQVLAAAQIVCLPSYREGLPKVLLEAAAVGRPIVTTDVPGCREVVTNRENGLLVPARDIDALCAALEELIRSPDLCNEMGSRGRARAQSFSLDFILARTMDLYEEVLGTVRATNLLMSSAE